MSHEKKVEDRMSVSSGSRRGSMGGRASLTPVKTCKVEPATVCRPIVTKLMRRYGEFVFRSGIVLEGYLEYRNLMVKGYSMNGKRLRNYTSFYKYDYPSENTIEGEPAELQEGAGSASEW